MSELLQAFVLGNQAILTNVCMLPLYPGLIAFLAGNIDQGNAGWRSRWLGVLVLAGVLTMMLLIGFVLYLARQSFDSVLPVLLPVVYVAVFILGVLMLLGRNPFKQLSAIQMPAFRNPYIGAFTYGLLLGPMTLPCTGPLITSAFVLGGVDSALLPQALLYFLFFGLGFGWPLVVLPFIAGSAQRSFTRWLTQHSGQLARVSGVLLVIIAIIGITQDVLPNV
jgi:cytochrome c-type biogenesis protein